MALFDRFLENLKTTTSDENFSELIEFIVVLVAKILSLIMLVVILFSLSDLIVFLSRELLQSSHLSFKNTLFEFFGLILNVLIALEILENITGYLKKQVFHVELVIGTSLIAVARKIIILDLEKKTWTDLIGLAIAVVSLATSYWLIREANQKRKKDHHQDPSS